LYESLAKRRPPPQALRWAAGSIGRGAQVVSVRRLRGGTSTAIHAIDVEDRRGRRHRLVLRRFIRSNWQRPDLPRREATVLGLLRDSNVPAPHLVAVDADAQACDTPALLMTRLSGRVDLTPKDMRAWLGQMAAALPPIHDVPPSRSVRPYRPYTDPRTLGLPAWSAERAAWKQVLDLARGPRPRSRPCFIHRDYHPANVLWSRGRLSGVIDWINASIGSPGIDLGHCRVNLVELYGMEAADRFLDAYLSLLGLRREDHDPYWDAITACDSGFATEPEPFPGWRGFGPQGITRRIIKDRLDAYAVAIAARC
jgi:aminoglycoside phosphotransferase (APT) family kinase protein